jgi:hypothetical protein
MMELTHVTKEVILAKAFWRSRSTCRALPTPKKNILTRVEQAKTQASAVRMPTVYRLASQGL